MTRRGPGTTLVLLALAACGSPPPVAGSKDDTSAQGAAVRRTVADTDAALAEARRPLPVPVAEPVVEPADESSVP